jgi:hypothetical protein
MVFLDHSGDFLDRADGTVTGSVMVRIGRGFHLLEATTDHIPDETQVQQFSVIAP